MTEFLVIGLTVAIVLMLKARSNYNSVAERRDETIVEKILSPYAHALYFAGRTQAVITSILLVFWLPVLALGIRDFPDSERWRTLFMLSPVTFLLLAPFICLWPWYRANGWKDSWRVLLCPLAIYLFPLVALKNALRSRQRQYHS